MKKFIAGVVVGLIASCGAGFAASSFDHNGVFWNKLNCAAKTGYINGYGDAMQVSIGKLDSLSIAGDLFHWRGSDKIISQLARELSTDQLTPDQAVKKLDTLYANPLLLGFAWQRGWLPVSYESLDRAIELNGVAVEKNRLAFEWGRYIAQHGETAADAFAPRAGKQQAIVVQMPESLERLIERNVERLGLYQNERYAARYVEVVERVRAAESKLAAGAKLRLTPVVARNLAKLMTYKDEYEVARLYADPAYLDKLRAQFEGEPGRDYKLAFHLAPPLLAKRDEHGHLKKQRFGQWTLTLFRVLAKLKVLRGTALDVFGKTSERRNERELIDQYIVLIDEFCATLDSARFDVAMKLANLPDEIRGFGHVKERNVLAAAAKRENWLAEYRTDNASATLASSSQLSARTI